MSLNFIFQKAVESTRAGVLVTDFRRADNPIIYSNPFFSELTGYSREEILGRNCRFLQGPQTDRQTISKIRKAIDAQVEFRGEILNYKKDGSIFWNYLIINPVKSSSGRTEYFVGIQHDITKEKLAAEERDRMINQLQAINAGLERFTADTSHELKNPIGVVIGFADLLEKDYSKLIDDKGLYLINRISANARYLNQCLEDLRQISILGQTQLTTEVVSLSEIVHEATQLIGLDQEQDIVHFQSDLPRIEGNRQLLTQVFRNLIDNAIKYGNGAKSGIYIDAHIGADDEYEIIVRDLGPGVPQSIRSKIFEPYISSGVPGITSTGLGLPIVKRIVELHRGTISFSSSPEGTSFIIQLPRSFQRPHTEPTNAQASL